MTTAVDPPPLTAAEIISLAQQNHLHPSLLSTSSHSTLISHLHARAQSPSPSLAVSEYTLSLLSLISLSHDAPPLSSLLCSLLSAYTHLFLSSQIPRDSNSLKTITLFCSLLPSLPVDAVVSIVDQIIPDLPKLLTLEDAQILELLPVCFALLTKEKGNECVNLIFDRGIIGIEWSKGLLVKFVFLARDFLGFLDKVRGREFLNKVFRGMKRVDLQDLPSLVYQLLVLASKGVNSHKRDVIEGIVVFFGRELGLRKVSSIVRQIEGTVLLHINFAVKQDPSLAKEVIGLVKLDAKAISHFTVAVLLSVARIKRCNEGALGVLKNAVLTTYRDYTFAINCKWLPDNLKEVYVHNVQIVEKALLRAVNESNCGREHIVPTIVQFTFTLLESSDEGEKSKSGDSNCPLGMEELSIQMLKTLFEVHDMSRNEIIDQCKFRILSLKPDKSIPIIRVLGYLVKSYPYLMLEHISRLKELLDYFTFMHSDVASSLVSALAPLLKFSRDLQDYIILVVRKAMFRREETVRLAATNAVVDLIVMEKQFKGDGSFPFQDSSSQASSSQQAEIATGGLFHELSGLLQRCLHQQAKIKEAMYQGLLKLVLVDPPSRGAVLDFLLPHFLCFFKEDEDVQLGITCCVKSVSGNVVIEEPLDSLLSCVSWILLIQPLCKTDCPDPAWPCFGFSLSQETEVGRNMSCESLSSALLKIRKFLSKGNLEDILGQSQDGNSTPLEEERRKCCALVLSGIIEVILNNIANELEKATDLKKVELEKELVEVINLHESLDLDTCARQSTSIKRGNPRATVGTPINSKRRLTHERVAFLATSSLCQLMQTSMKLLNAECPRSLEASQSHSQLSSGTTLKCSKIVTFVLNSCLRYINSCPKVVKEDPLQTLMYGELKLVGPPLLKLILLLKSGPVLATSQKKKEKGRKEVEHRKEHLHLALLCLKELITVSLLRPESSYLLEDLLSVSIPPCAEVDSERDEASKIDDQHIRSKELFIVQVLKPLFSELLSLSSFSEVEILCDMILMIGEKSPSKRRNSLAAWSIRACRSNETKNSKVARRVATLALSLSSPPDDLVVAQEMGNELLKVIGSEESSSLEASELYPIINKSTSIAITSCILELVEAVVSEMDWAVKKLKTFYVVSQKSVPFSQNEEHASGLAFESNLYMRADALVKVLSSFVLMNLQDPQADHFLRLTAKFYKHLAQISKLAIARKGCKQLLPSLTFQKLVELTCKQLTVPLYNFVAEMQREPVNTNSKGIINKIKRENRCIPELIYQIEDYEKYLIQLSKASKVNLLRHAKRSTARDFKILIENPDVGGDNEEEEEEDAPNNETVHDADPPAENGSRDEEEEEEEEEDAPNNETVHDADPPAENGSRDDSDDNNDDESADGSSPKRQAGSHEESASDGETLLPNAKRMKGCNVVRDSDEEA